jgi:hypothetical protein
LHPVVFLRVAKIKEKGEEEKGERRKGERRRGKRRKVREETRGVGNSFKDWQQQTG